jgi:hypothetical protein
MALIRSITLKFDPPDEGVKVRIEEGGGFAYAFNTGPDCIEHILMEQVARMCLEAVVLYSGQCRFEECSTDSVAAKAAE